MNAIITRLRIAVGLPSLLAAITVFASAPARAADEPIPHEMVPRDRWTGEPYALGGNRLAFVDWSMVRPGGYGWVDAQGQGVTASRAKIGPGGATFHRGDDAPRGIRLAIEKPLREGPILAAEKIRCVLTNDPGMGVIRHVDAGYDRAVEVAEERDVRIPMREALDESSDR